MTLPHFSQTELINYLADHGWKEVSNRDWETHQRIIIGDGKDIATLQLRSIYYYHHVVKLCLSLGIDSPPEHLKVYDQIKNLINKKKEEEPGEE